MRALVLLILLTACGEVAWNTRVADAPPVRAAMIASVVPGRTTEGELRARWGNPTQKIRQGGQVSYVYRNMMNPPGYYAPQFGNSNDFVVVTFQYGYAINAYSGDTQGCRATFPPRPPGPGFDNPSTVYPANCGDLSQWIGHGGAGAPNLYAGPDGSAQSVTPDLYRPDGGTK